MTNIGYMVGLGNLWRFPSKVLLHGGGAFLIPYFLTVVLCAFPMLYLEMMIGQFASEGAVSVWNFCPILKGVGVAILFNLVMINIYYSVIVMYSLYYMAASFVNIGGPLPWGCANRTQLSGQCGGHTPETYWNEFALRVRNSWEPEMLPTFDNLGPVVGRNAICLLFVWLFVFYCCLRGIRAIAKI